MFTVLAPIISAVLPMLFKTIDKAIPDKEAAEKIKLEIMKLQHDGQLKEIEREMVMAAQQAAITKTEAASESLFKSGGRPFLIWVCGLSVAYTYLVGPMLMGVLSAFGVEFTLPQLNMYELMALLFGMLGLGAYRSFDKAKDAQTKLDKEKFYASLRQSLGGSISQKTVEQVEKALADANHN